MGRKCSERERWGALVSEVRWWAGGGGGMRRRWGDGLKGLNEQVLSVFFLTMRPRFFFKQHAIPAPCL